MKGYINLLNYFTSLNTDQVRKGGSPQIFYLVMAPFLLRLWLNCGFESITFEGMQQFHSNFKMMFLLLLIYCCMYLPLFVVVLCLSLFWYALFYVLFSFAITKSWKREVVALLLLSFGCLVTVNDL